MITASKDRFNTDMYLNVPWTDFTPTVTAGAGTITSYTINRARYRIYGQKIWIECDITIDDNGTGSGDIRITVPTGDPALTYYASFMGTGRELNVTGKHLQCLCLTDFIIVWNFDNSYPAGTGYRVKVTASNLVTYDPF